mgnify:CR=1 FL=1
MSILKAILKEAILFGNYRHFGAKAIFRANEQANLLGVSPESVSQRDRTTLLVAVL